MNPTDLRIHPERLQTNFQQLAQIGRTPAGGIHRPTFSPAHLQARAWFRQKISEAGMDHQVDNAGNHSAILRCGPEGGPTLLIGSHLDSVPNGGRFDGALGVLAALEVLQTVGDAGLALPFHLEAIDFTDEEGTLFGLLGSAALTGELALEDLQEPRGGRTQFLESIAPARLSEDGICNAKRAPQNLAGYLELHIEQGPRLADAGVDIGIVSSIVGICSYLITFVGSANHAGTTDMENRQDAALGVCAFTLAVRELLLQDFPDCVANIGEIKLEPGAFNIIPGRATASLEFRAPTMDLLEGLEPALLQAAQSQADQFGLGLETESLGAHPPAPMDPHLQEALERAAHSIGLQTARMASGAGHDAQMLAVVCPAGMIFVPSTAGISHAPQEHTPWQDCINGTNTLLLGVLETAARR